MGCKCPSIVRMQPSTLSHPIVVIRRPKAGHTGKQILQLLYAAFFPQRRVLGPEGRGQDSPKLCLLKAEQKQEQSRETQDRIPAALSGPSTRGSSSGPYTTPSGTQQGSCPWAGEVAERADCRGFLPQSAPALPSRDGEYYRPDRI